MTAVGRCFLYSALVLAWAVFPADGATGWKQQSYTLSAYQRPHLTNAPPSLDSVLIPREMADIRLTIAGPQPNSPLRNSSIDSVASVLREGAQLAWFRVPSKRQVLEFATCAADSLKIRDLFWTFASPAALHRIVSTQKVTFSLKYRRQRSGADEGPITIFAIDPTSPQIRRVVCPKESGTFVPASWKRWWQGEELTISLLPDSTTIEQCVTPTPAVASTEFHLQRAGSKPARDLFSTEEPLPTVDVVLSATVVEAVDVRMLLAGLIVGLFLIAGQRLSQAPISQFLVGLAFGPIALLVALIGVLAKPVIPRSWVGRSLLFGIIFSGCLSSVSLDSLTPSAWIAQIPKDTAAHLMLGSACVSLLAAIVIRWKFPEALATATALMVRAVECAFALWFSWVNPEVVTLIGMIVPIAYMWYTRHESQEELVVSSRSTATRGLEDPKDQLPQTAYFAKEFVPTKAQRFRSGAPEQKFELYAKEGDEYTRRELEKLADNVRRDSAFAKFVRNPNELYRFAGEPHSGRRT